MDRPSPTALAGRPAPAMDELWAALRGLVDRLFASVARDTVVDDSIDIVVELLGADRGLVLIAGEDGVLRPVNARGRKRALSAAEQQEVSRTIARQVLETGRCVVWDQDQSGPPSQSAVELGLVAALAAPLHSAAAGDGVRGVLYVDVRDARKHVERPHVEFFMSAAVLLGAILHQEKLARADREHLREARAHVLESSRAPPLDELLAGPGMSALRRDARAAVHGDAPVLVLGESGTGKTLVATAIAEASRRRPIFRVMLGASDDLNTITSDLFGHERGAFSGATSRRVGQVEYADGGTLIFDEVLNLSLHAQRLLLDFTQFGTYRPLGYDRPEPKRASVRIIAATNGDVAGAVREGRFRQDLYHRLAGMVLEVPPLRARREEIPALAEAALRRWDPSRAWSLPVPLRRLLVSPDIRWSGNVRQLEQVIRRARDRAVAEDPRATVLTPEHLELRDLDRDEVRSPGKGTSVGELQRAQERLDEEKARLIREALDRNEGNVSGAARELGVPRSTLASWMAALRLEA